MKTIRYQITRAMLVLLVMGFTLLLFVVDDLLRRNLQEELIDNLKIQCRLADELLYQKTDSLAILLPRIAELTSERITVLDEAGRVLGDFDQGHFTNTIENHINRPEIQDALKNLDGFGSAIRYSATVKEDLVYTAYKSPHKRFVRLAQKQASIDGIIVKVRWIFFSAAVGAIGLVILLTLRISKSITQPLAEIISASNEIKSGNYDREIIVQQGNEFGSLAKNLNDMSAKLKDDIRRLNVLQDIRKDFVANASHELRTPISSVRGYVETLLDGAYHDEEVSKKFLERSHSNILRLENIVNDMLDLSRLESRDKGLSLRYFDPKVMVANIVADLEDKATKKGLKISLNYDAESDFRLLADPFQFDKAVINLVENAVKYTDQGEVSVCGALEEKFFVLKISDTGNGIPSEEISRIFERFYRVDKGRARTEGGSGLGLAIVKHVMEIHEGSVSCESEVGKGTTFTLRFPKK